MISIVIPTYLQPIYGGKMLIVLLNSIRHQKTTCDYEVIVSDNDETGAIKAICDNFKQLIPIYRHFNPIKGASENFNHGMGWAGGEKIKLMCMDDAFVTKNAIDTFNSALDHAGWVISDSLHINENGNYYSKRFTKYDHNNMETNQTGMPTVIGYRNCDLRFDPRVKTFCDTFFYYQLYERYGPPDIIREFTVACRFWKGSLSHNQPSNKKADLEFLRKNKLIKC